MKYCVRYSSLLALLTLASPALAQQAPVAQTTPAIPTAQGRAMPAPQAPRPAVVSGRAHADSADEVTAPQAFSVVLVLGDMAPATAQDNVPAAARKALADMKDFLPYKNYRLLDTQWTLCCGREAMTSRLKGADDQEYQLQLSASMVGAGRVNVRFYLGEASGLAAAFQAQQDASNESRAEIEQQLARLRAQYVANTNRVGENHPDQLRLKKEIESLQAMAARRSAGSYKVSPMREVKATRAIIDTSFRMDVGETVVVGTSRTRGDKALIALLTAVPPKTATTGR